MTGAQTCALPIFATELLIINDGDEGLFCAYDNVEFLAPVFAGDYIEAVGEITNVGNNSRKMKFEARKVIAPRTDISASAADVLAEPIVVCLRILSRLSSSLSELVTCLKKVNLRMTKLSCWMSWFINFIRKIVFWILVFMIMIQIW